MEFQRTGLAKISQRLAAVQYFDPAERRFVPEAKVEIQGYAVIGSK